ncbi:MAG: ATPase domain-containing protein [Thermoplasmatota archaeon]
MSLLDFGMDRDDLCDRLGGGLPSGSLVVLEGRYGAGKSILVQRVLQGLVGHGTSACYVSTELTTSGFLAQMASLRYPVQESLLDERLVFIPLHPLIGARAPRNELLTRIAQARRLYSKDVVVFDTFSRFLADHLRSTGGGNTALEQVEAVLHLFKRLTSLGKTILLTFEEGQVPDGVTALFKEAADLYLSIQSELQGASANRRIVVQRMSRAHARYGEVIGFRVEPGVGIVIEIKSVV